MELKLGLNNRHIAIAQHMVLHPELKQYEIAEVFGVTKEFISALTRNDAFQALLNNERERAHTRALEQREEIIQEQVYNNLEKTLSRVEKELEFPDVELKDLNNTMNILGSMTNLKRAGATQQQQVPERALALQVNVNVLKEAQERLNGRAIPHQSQSDSGADVCEAEFYEEKENQEENKFLGEARS